VFVAQDVETGVRFSVARSRLVELIGGRALADASHAAYGAGLASLLGQPGSARPVPARLMRVRCLEPVHGAEQMTAGLRWEAAGAPGGLFPVLDADLTVAASGPQVSRLALAGVYRLPAGDELDPASAGQVADTTVRALLGAVAAYLSATSFPAARLPRAAGRRSRPAL
jgi:hypothetical protein